MKTHKPSDGQTVKRAANSPYYVQRRPEIYRLVPAGVGKVLEIGCAAGCFYDNFPERIEYWGVEPNAEACAMAAEKGIRTLCGTYDSVEEKIPDEYFDVIVCNDVIEHTRDEYEFLRSVKRKLRPGGMIVGSIPNVRFWGNLLNLLVRRDWKYEDGGILDRTHLRFFTKKSFLRLARAVGFSQVRLSPIDTMRMKILKVVFAPCLFVIGFDVSCFQFAVTLKV